MLGFKNICVLFILLFVREALVLGSKVIQDKLELVSYSKEYIQNPKFALFDKDGSENKAFNMSLTVKKDLPNVIMMHVQVYKLTNKDYRIFPLNITTDICPGLQEDSPQKKEFQQHSNIRGCPFKKGFYYVRNFAPSQSAKVPPYIPTGSYMAESKTTINNGLELLKARFYTRIV